jgi:hypothetical protein
VVAAIRATPTNSADVAPLNFSRGQMMHAHVCARIALRRILFPAIDFAEAECVAVILHRRVNVLEARYHASISHSRL